MLCIIRSGVTTPVLFYYLALLHCGAACSHHNRPGKGVSKSPQCRADESFDIKHRLTTCYHPQANGLDERYNQTLVNALAKYAQDNRGTWDSNLKEIVYAYNTAVQESSQHTPFEAMFGRIARRPVDYNVIDRYNPDEQLQNYQDSGELDNDEREAKRRKLDASIKANIEKAQQSRSSTMMQNMGLLPALQLETPS